MPWHGRVFPRSCEDTETPEALPAREGVLPHLHEDGEDRFPRAVARDALEDQDPEDNGGLEERGKKIGIELGTSCGERSKEEANCLYDWCDLPYDVPETPQGTS
jgi:hypothetical protein